MEQTCEWLASVNLERFVPIFQQHKLAGVDLLDLNNDDLVSVGLSVLSDRKAILRAVYALKLGLR